MPNYGLLAQQGRREDNAAMGGQVAHISAVEAELLRLLGGAGTTNPMTGLPEYQMGTYAQGPGVAFTAGSGSAAAQAAAAAARAMGGRTSYVAGGSPSAFKGMGAQVSSGGMGFTAGESAAAAQAAAAAAAAQAANVAAVQGGRPGARGEALYGDRSWQESTPLSKEGENVAEGLMNFVTSYEGLKSKLGLGKLAVPLTVDAVISLGLKSFAKALTNTGGYYGAGQPGGVNPYSTPATVQLADVIAAPLVKPVEGEPFILPTDQKALEDAKLLELALLELLPNIEGFPPEIASIMQQFVEEKQPLGSTA